MTSSEMCTGIVKCLDKFWSKKCLLDFTIKIDDVKIECHRLILEACSDFFQALFNSGMKEVTEKCVVLKDISVTAFELVLKALYTGVDILTLENFLEVWQAVHRLQIRFMIFFCEKFAIKSISLEIWENIYKTAVLLNSDFVLDHIFLFQLKNFDHISKSRTFLLLPFEDVRYLIQSQDLVVSREDVVLESVIKWIDYTEDDDSIDGLANTAISVQPISEMHDCNAKVDVNVLRDEETDSLKNNSCHDIVGINTSRQLDTIGIKNVSMRGSKLVELLKLVRTCLVRPSVLSRAFNNKLIIENEDARNILFNATLYHADDLRQSQWSTAAIHRDCSEYKCCGVYASSSGSFKAFILGEKKWIKIPNSTFLRRDVQIVVFDNYLYAVGVQYQNYQNICRLCVLCDNTWIEVVQMSISNHLLVSYGHFIFIFNKEEKIIYTVRPKEKKAKLEKFTEFPDQVDIEHAMVLGDCIVVFASVVQAGIDETAVYSLDIFNKIWTRLDNLEGPAKQLISFKNDQNSYILQSNGSLWTLKQQHDFVKVEFKFITKIWDFEKKLNGALSYKEKIIIFGNDPKNDPPDGKKLYSVDGHIQEIKHWGVDDHCSNFIPAILEKKYLPS